MWDRRTICTRRRRNQQPGLLCGKQQETDGSEDIALAAEIQKEFLDSGNRRWSCRRIRSQRRLFLMISGFPIPCADGKEYSWYYDRASMAQLKAMLSLEDSPEVRENQRRVFYRRTERSGTCGLDERGIPDWRGVSDRQPVFRIPGSFPWTKQGVGNCWRLWRKMWGISPWRIAISRKKTAAGVLMFTRNAEYDLTYYSYHLDNAFIYLTDELRIRSRSWKNIA